MSQPNQAWISKNIGKVDMVMNIYMKLCLELSMYLVCNEGFYYQKLFKFICSLK